MHMDDDQGRHSLTEYKGTKLHEFICQLQPYYLESKSWMLDWWFEWPPDIFALTSLILSYTGAYRRAVAPASGVWPKADWPAKARSIATDWRNSIADSTTLPSQLLERKKVLEDNRDILVDRLYDSEDDSENPSGNPWDVCKALLELHAIADEAMRGVGIIYSPRSSLLQEAKVSKEAIPDKEPPSAADQASNQVSNQVAFFYLQANYLLTLRGSLSRVPKFRGIVLPKSRTPQIGLSLRSLSNHLTFHQSEVDVAWRAFPWFNFDENTLNIMVIPWPYDISATHFSPVLHPKTREELGTHRYFHYEPSKETELDVEKLVRLIKNARREVRRVHLLVFPEMALRRRDLKRLKALLESELKPHEMPMIIAGVSARLRESHENSKDKTPGESGEAGKPDKDPLAHFQADRGAAGFNRVILSVYYAEKWHDVIQDKHHRWRVDSQQIEQYNLGGVLSGGRTWWEAIHIPRRRLSVLAANSWLTICPLICEDLARLEPVSDLIRGIGPTLVTALLLDGPQLKDRWPARYASVLADDPGSSVLTLTALGMSRRSRPPGEADLEAQRLAREKANTVALWKDQVKGWREIRVGNEEPHEPKVLIVSAQWTTEFTIDGRTEAENSAVFTYQGMYQPIDEVRPGQAPPSPVGTAVQEAPSDEQQQKDEPRSRADDAKRKSLKVLDMCELTLYTYYVDALVDSKTEVEDLRNWFDETIRTKEKDPLQATTTRNSYSRLVTSLIHLSRYSIQTRDSVPDELPSPHLIYAIDSVSDLVRTVMARVGHVGSTREELCRYWEELTKESADTLRKTVEQLTQWIKQQDDPLWEQILADRESAVERSQMLSGARFHTRTHRPADTHMAAYEIGRIRLSTPLSILWSIHVRLATRRRYGTLQPDDAVLLERIEGILAGDSRNAGGDYHQVYLQWKAVCKEKEPRAPEMQG